MKLLDKVKIFSKTYSIKYHKNPSEVDLHNRDSLWGQCDFWSQSIRIYKGDNNDDDVWQTVFHEVLHVIAMELAIDVESGNLNSKENEKAIDLLSLGMLNFLAENKIDFSKMEK